MRRIWEKFCAFSLGLLLGISALVLLYPPSRQWPAQIIYRHDLSILTGTPSADAIIMLMGNVPDRSQHCAKLIKKGMAPVIVFVETERDELNDLGYRLRDGESSLRYLQKLGVTEKSILFDNKKEVSSTAEEIQADFEFIHTKLPQAKRIILCTSWYHSSRTQWIAEKYNIHNYELKSNPSPMPKSWYAKEFDFLMVFNEYLKWMFYLIHY